MDLEITYEICGCTEDQKVLYAGYLSQEEVGIWWDTRRQLLVRELGSPAALSWKGLKEEFDNRLFLDSVKQLKAQEFTTLTKDSLTVEQYAAKFMTLGRFAPHLISTQRMQTQKFQVGLQPMIHNQVPCLRIENYQELVNVADIAETEYRGLTAHVNSEKKRAYPFSVSGSSSDKRVMIGEDKGKDVMIGG
ncbi:hypothetical protein F2P56_026959 [Juglans regia]|uniref:Retrotransposon gag domain-containing protein n=2 Tax=Juglans regia TaxID=51240 RepID=A0A833U9M6_JUGRE|nr:uncharacterized protein LOC109020883 [Juglans regia]KAF5451903.1 hypothetical protein F2P56_026959 [Juglans regia]